MTKTNIKNRITAILQKLGLGENEATLYNLMLAQPKSTVQELQSKTPFPRTMLYYILNNLKAVGLVTYKKSGWRTEYLAESPDRLYELLAKREEDFKIDTQQIQKLVPELKNTYRLANERPDTQILVGIDNYKLALEGMLQSNPEIILQYKYTGPKGVPGFEVRADLEARRLHKRIPLKMIVANNDLARSWVKQQPYDDYTWHRYAPPGLDVCTNDVYLFGNKMLFVTHDNREPISLLVEEKELSKIQTNLFLFIWQMSQER